MMTELNQINKANKAAVGTFFSVRNPKDGQLTYEDLLELLFLK